MKRKFKRIASLVLAMVMVFAMAMPAMAEAPDNFTEFTSPKITIETTTKDHIYEAYQIFGGEMALNSADSKYYLSNIVWGSGVNKEAIDTDDFKNAVSGALQKYYKEEDPAWDATNAEIVAAALNAGDTEAAEAFAQVIANYLNKTAAATSGAAEGSDNKYSYSITVDGVGYYFIKDQDGSLAGADNAAYTKFMLEVVGNVNATAKSSYPTVEKKVKEKNDSTGAETDWQDAADHDINDHVSFQLTGTVADNYSEYTTYYYAFHDTLTKGLTFEKDSVKVTINGTTIDKEDYTVSDPIAVGDDGSNKIDITFTNLKAVMEKYGIEVDPKTTKIVVEYTALLNENAVVGSTGNPNDVTLEYSNNPNNGGSGTGETPKDTVIVFTFQTDVDKLDEENQPLKGAEFTLLKWTAGTPAEGEEPAKDADEKEYPAPDGAVDGFWKDLGPFTVDTNGTEFSYKGLDSGMYKLVESKTPDGYNTIAPIDFEIKATYDEKSATPGLNTLEAPSKAEFGANKESGIVDTDIINKKGTTLPETGGIGTTIFYVVGSVLVLGAVILLVTKRRMKG